MEKEEEQIKTTQIENVRIEEPAQLNQKGSSCYDEPGCREAIQTLWVCTLCLSCINNLFFCCQICSG